MLLLHSDLCSCIRHAFFVVVCFQKLGTRGSAFSFLKPLITNAREVLKTQGNTTALKLHAF